MPEEFFRLPYAAAASDVIRAAAVHHHGGLYMDTDFVIVNPLEKHLELLHEWLVIVMSRGLHYSAPSELRTPSRDPIAQCNLERALMGCLVPHHQCPRVNPPPEVDA